MADIAIFRINYKSDFILTLQSDAGWLTPFCIKFWTGAPSQAYFAGYDGTTYTHCAPVDGDPTKLSVQFDDHHLPIGDLKFQIGYHFTVADFPTSIEDEVINQAAVIIDNDGEQQQVMLDFNGETAPDIAFSLPAYANEAQRIANEQVRIAAEEQRVSNEQQRISNEEGRISAEERRQEHEQQRIHNEETRIAEFARLEADAIAATGAANDAATLANEKAQLASDKAALAQSAATLASDKAQLAADKAALAQAAATLANDKAALAQQKADYAQAKGDYAQAQGDYAKAQGDIALADHERAETDHERAETDHERAEADHDTATDDHTTATSDHTQAESDHTRAEADHTTAASDHTQASSDHDRAESDHTKAGQDHDRAESDHTTAAADHTRAESDHAAVEVYVDSLGAFDISAYHATGSVLAKYADLTAALGTNGANIPDALRKGGMSVKFVLSSDNNYVQHRYMGTSTANADFTNVANWQGVDESIVAGSKSFPQSDAIVDLLYEIVSVSFTDFKPTDLANGYVRKTDGSNGTSSSNKRTDYIPINDEQDLIVLGGVTANATPLALYSTNSANGFLWAEQNNGLVYVSSARLKELGAKYFRCTFTSAVLSSGRYFAINENLEWNYFKLANALGSLLNEKPELISGIAIRKTNGKAYNSENNYATDFIPIENGCSVFVYGSTGSVATSLALYSSNDENSFIEAEQSKNTVIKTWNELQTIGATYFRATIYSGQVSSGDWFVACKSMSSIIAECNAQINLIKNDINEIESDINGGYVINDKVAIDLTWDTLTKQKGYLQSSRWYSTSYRSAYLSPAVGKNGIIVTGGTNGSTIFFSKAQMPNEITNNNVLEQSYFPTGKRATSVFNIPSGETQVIEIPEGTVYIYINNVGTETASGQIPSSMYFAQVEAGFNLKGRVESLEDENKDTYFGSNVVPYDIANSVGNTLIPLNVEVDSNGHVLPQSVQEKNIQQKAKQFCLIQWTCKKDIPYRHDSDDGEGGSSGAYAEGTTITGMPYSSVKEIDKYIGFDVSVLTFMTAVNNPYSLLYTENVSEDNSKSDWGITYHGTNCATYYGTVCSEFSSYADGMSIIISTNGHKWLAEYAMKAVRLYNQTENNLRIGDILVRYNKSTGSSMHCMLVVDIVRNANGDVTSFKIAQSTGNHVQYASKTKIAETNNTIVVYRFIELYKNIGYDDSASEFIDLSLLPNPTYSTSGDAALIASAQKTYNYNNDICTFAGDKACFAEGDLVVLNYNLSDDANFQYTDIELYKDEVLLETYNIASIDQSELPVTQQGHALKLGTGLAPGDYKARCKNSSSESDYTFFEVIDTSNVTIESDFERNLTTIDFTSTNGTPVCVMLTNISGGHLAMRELTENEVLNGEIKSDFIRLYKEHHDGKDLDTSAQLWIKLYFKGKYGRVVKKLPYMNVE